MEVVDVEVAVTPAGVVTCGGSVLSLEHAETSAKSAAADAKAIARGSIRINAVSGVVRLVDVLSGSPRRGAGSAESMTSTKWSRRIRHAQWRLGYRARVLRN